MILNAKFFNIAEYYVQTGPGISENFQFRTFDSGSDFRPTVALFGDLGTYYNVSVPKLTKLAKRGEIDLVIQAGDMAYDLNHDLGKMGDKYMNLIQPIASRVPYNFAAGNHEKYNNFSQFRGRFSSPGPNVFYNSFNVGPVHFVILTTEFYMFDEFGTGQIQVCCCIFWVFSVIRDYTEVCDQKDDKMFYIAGKNRGIRNGPDTDSVAFVFDQSSLVFPCSLVFKNIVLTFKLLQGRI